MKFEYKVCGGAALFLAIAGVIYWFWSREDTGTVLLGFGAAGYTLIAAFFVLQWHRRQGIPRPEDRLDAEQSDGAGEVGFFPAASIWPAGMGLGAVFIGAGLIYGTWYWAIGGVLMLGAIIGYVVEAEAREEGPDDPGMPIDPTDSGAPATSADVPSAYRRD
jgi:hypothetical protein